MKDLGAISVYAWFSFMVFLESMYQEITWADEVAAPSQSAVVDGVFPPGQSC